MALKQTMRYMEEHKEFPGFWAAVAILAVLFGLQIIIAVIAYGFGFMVTAGDPKAIGVITVLSCGIIFSVLMSYKKMDFKALFNPSRNSLKNIVLLLTFPIALTVSGAVVWISDLTNLIISYYPMDQHDYEMFARLTEGGVVSILTICIIAPFIEEMLFRGLLLRSFLYNYSNTAAILLSAALFALYHLNIYQLPVALLLGTFLGWLYLRTHSLWPCILGHSLYNTAGLVFGAMQQVYQGQSASPAVQFNSLGTNMAAILATVIGIMMLTLILKPAPGAKS